MFEVSKKQDQLIHLEELDGREIRSVINNIGSCIIDPVIEKEVSPLAIGVRVFHQKAEKPEKKVDVLFADRPENFLTREAATIKIAACQTCSGNDAQAKFIHKMGVNIYDTVQQYPKAQAYLLTVGGADLVWVNTVNRGDRVMLRGTGRLIYPSPVPA